MPDVNYLFFHTAAADIRNVDAQKIDEWHRAKGWAGIGYHYVIIDDRHDSKPDGLVEKGRPESRNGAHIYGGNKISLGVCCVGHGNKRDFTNAQKQSLVRLLADLAEKYDVPTQNILGHREVNDLVAAGILGNHAKTTKSCPGHKVSTDEIRGLVDVARATAGTGAPASAGVVAETALIEAIRVIARAETLLGNATDEWRAFYYNGEVQAMLAH